MLQVLSCCLASPGWVFPQIAIAHALRDRGHSVRFATGRQFRGLLEAESFARIPSGENDVQSFDVSVWHNAVHIAAQVRHIEYAISRNMPDILVTSQLGLGAFICARRYNIPLAVIGLAAYLYPHHDASLTNDEAGEAIRKRRDFYWLDILAKLNSACDVLDVPHFPQTVDALLGSKFLLQAIPECYASKSLGGRVTFVGSLAWDIHAPPDTEISKRIHTARADGRQIVYVQPGRDFGFAPGLWDRITSLLIRRNAMVFISAGRMEMSFLDAKDLFIKSHIPQGLVLPYANAVISNGHTTSVLGAVTHGVPMFLFPNGSGTDEISDLYERMGVATILNPRNYDRLDQKLSDLSSNSDLYSRIHRTMERFGRLSGPQICAREICHLASQNNDIGSPDDNFNEDTFPKPRGKVARTMHLEDN